MRVREMHPLCCITLESTAIDDRSPEPTLLRTGSAVTFSGNGSDFNAGGSDAGATSSSTSVAGILYKWTNYGKGWRSRWFTLRDNGILSYSKTRRPDTVLGDDVILIGRVKPRSESGSVGGRKHGKSIGIVHLKISSFRESKSDDRRFYIFTATKTLHLRTNSRKERAAWIQALVSTRSLYSLRPLNDNIPILTRELSVSTERLKKRLLDGGIDEGLIKDCEQIMLSEFSEIQGQMKVLCDDRSNLLDTLRQLEAANVEAEASGINDGEYQLIKQDYSNLVRGKYSEWSTTESSDDIEKQDLEEVSDEEEASFFDTNEYFSESPMHGGSEGVIQVNNSNSETQSNERNRQNVGRDATNAELPQIVRRTKLPDPAEKEKGVSLWSMIKDNIGKDLTRVCLPVYFNEPISSLQKCFEELEYSNLLDQAYEYGKAGNSLLRIVYVAAFAVSGYASSEGRHCKPFNPLLGETYEADFPEKGIRFFSEKAKPRITACIDAFRKEQREYSLSSCTSFPVVYPSYGFLKNRSKITISDFNEREQNPLEHVSHHPTLIACQCEGRGWKFWGDSNIKSKFWGRSIQLDPVGTLTVEFDDGEIVRWSKVTTSIYNLILGNIYCDHHGTMHLRGNGQHSCKLKFKEQSILERNPHQVHGFVEDAVGKRVATVFGKWDDSMYYVNGETMSRPKDMSNATLLWKRNKPPPNPTRYNLTSFAITLNELTPGLKEKLPPTDSRLRPDQRYLENGEYDKANAEKLRLEQRQRMSRKLQENGWKPRWFHRDDEEGSFRYIGGYWEAREQGKWDECPNIFGEIRGDLLNSFEGS